MVPTAPARTNSTPIHPLHAILLASSVPLFLGGLLSDLAYSGTYEVQWKNFASWLIVGALLFGGFALIWALVDLFRARWRGRILYFLLLLAAWILGIINALVHAKDAWASMPEGLALSAVTSLLALAATGFGFFALRAGRPT